MLWFLNGFNMFTMPTWDKKKVWSKKKNKLKPPPDFDEFFMMIMTLCTKAALFLFI